MVRLATIECERSATALDAAHSGVEAVRRSSAPAGGLRLFERVEAAAQEGEDRVDLRCELFARPRVAVSRRWRSSIPGARNSAGCSKHHETRTEITRRDFGDGRGCRGSSSANYFDASRVSRKRT